MKKRKYILAYSAILLMIFFNLLLFSSCHKEKDLTAVISVKYLTDTTKQASNALVKIYIDKNKLTATTSNTYDTVYGRTDIGGEYTAKFRHEAIYNIIVQKDKLKGQSIIRLKPDKTVYQTVFIH